MIEVYTDGSSLRNGDPTSPGTYAIVVVEDGKKVYEYSFHEQNGTTNNRMEMMALKQALQWLRLNNSIGPISIYSDSQIVVKGYNDEWKRKSNTDIWEWIMASKLRLPNVKVKWIKGHSGNEWNEYVDKLCTSCYPKVQKEVPERQLDDRLIKGTRGLLRAISVCLKQLPESKLSSDYFDNIEDIRIEIEKHLKLK